MADRKYQKHTTIIHAALAIAAVLVAGYDWHKERTDLMTSLVLTGVTNAAIALEKLDLIRRDAV